MSEGHGPEAIDSLAIELPGESRARRAAVDEHGLPARWLEQDRVALPHVEHAHLESRTRDRGLRASRASQGDRDRGEQPYRGGRGDEDPTEPDAEGAAAPRRGGEAPSRAKQAPVGGRDTGGGEANGQLRPLRR